MVVIKRTVICILAFFLAASGTRAVGAENAGAPTNVSAFIGQYCAGCHNSDKKKGDLDLEGLSTESLTLHSDSWERVIRKLRARQMPPEGKRRPAEKDYTVMVEHLASTLDRAASEHPNPGRTETLRRLNRTEYQNAIRDLLNVEVDAAAWLPKDDASHGFDNVTVGVLSPTLLDRYISAAEKTSRLAIGAAGERIDGADTIRIRPDITQEEHLEGLPLGTRGGVLIEHTFPQEGEYDIQVRLARDRNEEVEGLKEPHQMMLLLDGVELQSFTISPPGGAKNWEKVDQHLKARISAHTGPHRLGITFLKNPSELLETRRQPYQAHFNTHRHPRISPAIYQISINGPYDAKGAGDSPSRRSIFVCKPSNADDEESCARQILSTLMRRAYRRPVSEPDLAKPLEFYRQGRKQGGFDAGIENALNAILVSPEFLFRIERDPAGVPPKSVYAISDIELASRLSFFIWSSIPDDDLLEAAIRGELHKPEVLEHQARRMLKDERAQRLVTNFGEQWLYLRNLESFTPEVRLFPDFDDNLRQSFRTETEMLFETIVREDRSVLDFLDADYTFLNERLAKHYGIPNIYGSRFRKVSLSHGAERGGLLRQGSILTVTSYPTRTSPVLRGHWILANLIGTPPPPPPANVPALKENTISSIVPIRERLAEHRANPACAGCHNLMDPVGFALENFDAVGRWRTYEDGNPVDVSGGLPDGARFQGVDGLEQGLLNRPELFVGTLTEKLMTFALGRGVESFDAPSIRKIVTNAAGQNYRFSDLIVGIVQSVPFTMRTSEK